MSPITPLHGQSLARNQPSATTTESALRGCRLFVAATARDSFTEYHVTGTVESGAEAALAAAELFAQVAAALADSRIQVIQEKLYGLVRLRPEVMEQRELAYRVARVDPTVPVTWLEGLPLEGSGFVGLQIWGLTPRDARVAVTAVATPEAGGGRLVTGPGYRMLQLSSVRGARPGDALPAGAAAQADGMFANGALALQSFGLTYRHVARTWIYMARLLEWYPEFNRVRTTHYGRAGLLAGAGGPAFPASTGIQGHSLHEECLMDVLAVDAPEGACTVTPVRRSARQDPSVNYGSAFSRAMVLTIEGRKTVHISGTASIDSSGASVHVGNAELQSLETLLCVAAILEEQGGSLANLTSATLFCKTPEAWASWNRVACLLGIPAFPKVCVQADVCRADLLVELEAVAAI